MRQCDNWLTTLKEYVEDTESPRHFWFWSGLFTIGAALQRRVWFPFGMDKIFPNLFILVVAPPGWSRKGMPVGFAKRILEDIQLPTGIDSPTKRHLTKKLASLSTTEQFLCQGKQMVQAPLALISKELSSFLAVDCKAMIEGLTDIYDSHDKWDYGTSEKGEDFIRNVCVSCLFATTPDWIAENLPEEAIGGGFTSRFIIVSGESIYKEVAWPAVPDTKIYNKLKTDLEDISRISGELSWSKEAFDFYTQWYSTIRPWAEQIGDQKLYNNFSRIHIQAIKTAICLHFAESNSLLIEIKDIERSVAILKAAYDTASSAFASHGKNQLAISLDRIVKQIKLFRTITTERLLKLNYRDLTKKSLFEILENIELMKLIRMEHNSSTGFTYVHWIGKE